MKRHLLALTILSLAILSGCKKDAQEVAAIEDPIITKEASKSISGQFVPNELLVKFKSGTSERSRTQTLSFINGKVSEHILTNAMQTSGDNEGIYLVNTTTDVFAAMARMKGESNIEYAEPNWIYTHQDASNDRFYSHDSLWGMYGTGTTPANQFGSNAGAAWNAGHTGSSLVYVGVIDEGAMFDHADLAGNFWTNPYDPIDGIDNDGNGKVDDIHGWDFANNDNTTFDGTSDDHGTHVSGTIGGKGGNSIGVAGVNWNITLISAKFLGRNGGTTANAIAAVDYITDLKTSHGLNIVATNNSWGGGGFSQLLMDAITRAGNAGILFIAAAGNSSADIDNSASYPAAYTNDNIIAVAALQSDGGIASYSNFGATSVDIGAPGSAIISTVPTSSKGKIVSAYASFSGTSMATPHVTGAAALYAATKGLHPTDAAGAAVIKNAILNSAVATSSLSGKCKTGGRLDINAALGR